MVRPLSPHRLRIKDSIFDPVNHDLGVVRNFRAPSICHLTQALQLANASPIPKRKTLHSK